MNKLMLGEFLASAFLQNKVFSKHEN